MGVVYRWVKPVTNIASTVFLGLFFAGLVPGCGNNDEAPGDLSAINGTLQVGEECSENSQCANNACGRPTYHSLNLLCCPSGAIDTYFFYDYCTGMPVNASCRTNAMCANHACGRPNANGSEGEQGEIICCASGEIVTISAGDYCTGLPPGTSCYGNEMCASLKCKFPELISSTGTCE